MPQPVQRTKKTTRIQRERREAILAAALDVFAEHGLRGATIDQIGEAAGMRKTNVFYYFEGKDAIYAELLESLLGVWLRPLEDLSSDGEPLTEILTYVQRKLHMSRDMPRESKLFATEILHGAPRTAETLSGDLKTLVDQKAAVIARWSAEGRIAQVDPHHLIFSIWALTQHYADFDIQVRAILDGSRRTHLYDEAEVFLTTLFTRMLQPDTET